MQQERDMYFGDLTHVVLSINAMIDAGALHDISSRDLLGWIDDKIVIQRVNEEINEHGHACHRLPVSERFVKAYHRHLNRIRHELDYKARFHVEKSGLCILLAMTIELIQRGNGYSQGFREDGPYNP